MKNIKQDIINQIKQYNNIAIFFHENPDIDALGSCYGLLSFLNKKFPKKTIKIVGVDILNENYENGFIFDRNPIDQNFFKKSLGIILDTADKKRIWTNKHTLCNELIRIDHHPKIESIAKYEWIDETYSATAEMITELIYEWDIKSISQLTCQYLYMGLLTDTNRFLYPSVTSRTLKLASKLIEKKIDRNKIHNIIYLKNKNEFYFKNYVAKKAHIDTKLGFAWAKISKNAYKKYNIKTSPSMVGVLANIKNIKIWFTYYYDQTTKRWKCSIRSNEIPINTLANKYCGGGHKLAAGLTFLNHKQQKTFLKDVKMLLKKDVKMLLKKVN